MTSTIVDWTLARQTANRLVKPGPQISATEAAAVVAELRECAERSEAYVHQVTGLTVESHTAPVLVVDRPSWIQANLDSFAHLLTPLNEKAARKLADGNPMVAAIGTRATGLEVGALFSYLAPKVLGQFDPFFPGGRLLLVAPNIVSVERELGIPAHDFRLWVCLHEETHRVQFTAVPWLQDYLQEQISALIESTDLDTKVLGEVLGNAVKKFVDHLGSDEELSIVDLVQTPAQQLIVDRITAVMSLLEGHADHVMDQVGPEVIGSLEEIRAKFTARRQGQGMDKVVRRLLGLDAKMRQYRDGAAFCRVVIGLVGMDGFNRVWSSRDTLPTRAEISDPLLWVDRVHATAGPS